MLRMFTNLQGSGNSERPKIHKALPAIINTLTTGEESLVELSACCIWHLEDRLSQGVTCTVMGCLIVQLSVSRSFSCKKKKTNNSNIHDPLSESLSELDKLIGSPS